MAEIAREGKVAEQNLQHFMSYSPWSGRAVIEQAQQAIMERSELEGGVLILDESADEKSGDRVAGAGRQHNGRMGKVDESQVGVYLAYTKQGHWTLWDGCLSRKNGLVRERVSGGRKPTSRASGISRPRWN
jgi:SRSO17 transposase